MECMAHNQIQFAPADICIRRRGCSCREIFLVWTASTLSRNKSRKTSWPTCAGSLCTPFAVPPVSLSAATAKAASTSEAPNPSVWAPNDFVGVVQVAGKNITTANFGCLRATQSTRSMAGMSFLGFGLKFYEAEKAVAFELSSNPNTRSRRRPQPCMIFTC